MRQRKRFPAEPLKGIRIGMGKSGTISRSWIRTSATLKNYNGGCFLTFKFFLYEVLNRYFLKLSIFLLSNTSDSSSKGYPISSCQRHRDMANFWQFSNNGFDNHPVKKFTICKRVNNINKTSNLVRKLPEVLNKP